MPALQEGYVLHTYGPKDYVRHAVASVMTLRRHDAERPVALYCPPSHREVLERYGLDTLFALVEDLPEDHCSIVGFKHHLHRFMPFDRCLFVDTDMVWCRDPDPLWTQLSSYPFTATGLERADFYFGGPKGMRIIFDIALNRRRRTMRRFNLTHLPRVQAGMIYAQDRALTKQVCETASGFLGRRAETHFRSRFYEGRTEESCEWSMAMAMSRLALPVYRWYQGYNSPQLDFIEGMTQYDPDFERVSCRYYCDRFIYDIRGIPNQRLRMFLLRLFSSLLGRTDYLEATPFALHFGWLHEKQPFYAFSARTWARLTQPQRRPVIPVE
ncbi:MAG: hypothetical protein ACE5G0_13190 [Rhodothermales bacterium]